MLQMRGPTPSVRLFVSALAAASEVRDEPVADKIVELPELMAAVPHFVVTFPAFQVRIEGANQVLSNQRAAAVAAILAANGISKEAIMVRGVGTAQPLRTEDSEEARRLNRSVTFRVTLAPVATVP